MRKGKVFFCLMLVFFWRTVCLVRFA